MVEELVYVAGHDTLYIRTLGELCILDGDDLMPLGQGRERALLVYLAFNIGRSIERETLVDLLWDGGGSRERRHGLSQLLYSLKRRYPLLRLSCTRNTVRLQNGTVGVDALKLLAAVDAGDTDTACELFEGQFLAGFYIDAVGSFEEWRESMTRTVNGAAARALRARLDRAVASGSWWAAERACNQLLELDPYNEEVHAIRIRSIGADGDNARALRELDRAVDLIRRDLGQPPGPGLCELIAQTSNIAPHDAGFEGEPAISGFIGRTAELDILRQLWRSVLDNHGAAIAVCGEAGIGKSRLCTQLLRVVAIEGGRVLDGRCLESSSRVPYSGICQVLSRIRDPDLAELDTYWRQALFAILPEFSMQYSDTIPSVELDAGGKRRLLFGAVVQLVKAMARHHAVALFLDDFQWADASTTELLHHIVRDTRDERVLILAAVRPEELSRAELAKHIEGFHVVTVEPMNDADAAELVAAVDKSQSLGLPAHTRQNVLSRGVGRPFLIVELVRYLATAEARIADDSTSGVDAIPSAIQTLLVRRLHGLSKAAAHAVDVLAILGGEATMTLLEQASRISTRELVTALEELQHGQIVQELGAAYAFTHDLMREATDRRMSKARRRWLNRTVGSALQRMPRIQTGTIALHMQAGGEKASAYSYALKAASQSQELFAHSEATFFLRLAAAAALDENQRIAALDRLCRHLYGLGDLSGARETLSELRPWYASNRDRDGMLIVAVAELHAALYGGKRPAVELRQHAMDLAKLIGESIERTESPAVALILQTFQTAYDAGHKGFITAFADAIQRQASIGPASLNRVRHLSSAAVAYALYIDASGGYDRGVAALQHARQIADPASELSAQLACGAASTLSGMYARAEVHFSRAWDLSNDDALQHLRRQVVINYAVLLMETGGLSRAKRLLEGAVTQATMHDRLFLFGNLAFVGLEELDWNSVRRYTEALEETNHILGASWAAIAAKMLNGFVALAEGQDVRARRFANELGHVIGAGPDVVAGMLDSSYTNILFARVGLLGTNELDTAAGLKRAADACRSTNVGAAARLDLERARVLRYRAPGAAAKVARGALEWAKEAGAALAAVRASEVIESIHGGS
ncbi:MAG: AAA family ATPase [Longimicrobiales bacterium]